MKVLVIQNCKTEGIGIYEEYLRNNKIDYSIFHAYQNLNFPSVKDYDAFIIGGTPISAYKIEEHDFLKKEWYFLGEIIEQNKPCLGICFGGQILARLLGAEVRKNPVMEIGGYTTALTEEGRKSIYFKDFPKQFPVFHWHGDTFDIPKGAQFLVKGKDCFNQAFSYRKAIGLQFHLEITADEASKWADKYSDELSNVNKTKTKVIQECRIKQDTMQKLAYKLMANVFSNPSFP